MLRKQVGREKAKQRLTRYSGNDRESTDLRELSKENTHTYTYTHTHTQNDHQDQEEKSRRQGRETVFMGK